MAVANSGDTMQGALDASPIIVAKSADRLHHTVDLILSHLSLGQVEFAVRKAGLAWPPQVEDHFEKVLGSVRFA
jgi:hypothetical protein